MTWIELINEFVASPEGNIVKSKVADSRAKGKVYPEAKDLFNAYISTPIETVKIVILGLDPYNSENHAHGLSFSSLQGNTPESLKIIFKELRRDIYPHLNDAQWKRFFPNNNLTPWAKKGVLLINRYLTVDEGKPKSHKDFGWDIFTKKVFDLLNKSEKPVVFMLWGNDAKECAEWITNPIHLKLEGAHPAADAYNPNNPKFYGCGHFREAIEFIKAKRPDESKGITLDIKNCFKNDMYETFLKEIKNDSYPFLFKDDHDAIENMRSALKLTYDYGFDFTLIK